MYSAMVGCTIEEFKVSLQPMPLYWLVYRHNNSILVVIEPGAERAWPVQRKTATCPLMLKAILEPRDSPVQHKKKYANQHWPTEHLSKQPSVIFKVTTIITPTVAIDNQASWIAFPECPCGPGYRTDNPNMPPVHLLHGSRTSSVDCLCRMAPRK